MLTINRNDSVLELSITGEIWPGDFEHLKANTSGKYEAVTLEICSEGGSLIDAFAIYNALKSIGNVTATVTGWAASSASVILMAADRIRICANSFIMIHEPSLCLWEANLTECQKAAGILESMRDTIAAAYAKRTKLGTDELKTMMKNETWLTADQALAAGFADEIIDAVEIAAKAKIPETLKEKIMGKAKISAEAAEEVKPCTAEADQGPAPAPETAPEKTETEPAEPVEEVKEEPDPVEELKKEAEKLKKEVDALKAENESLKEELTDLKDKAAKAVAGLRVSAKSETVSHAMSWTDALKDCGGDYQLARKKHPDSFGKMIAENR